MHTGEGTVRCQEKLHKEAILKPSLEISVHGCQRTMGAKHFRCRNPNFCSFPSDHYTQPAASGSAIFTLYSHPLLGPGDSNSSLAAAAFLVPVPIRELTLAALLLLSLPGPENSWSGFSALGEGGGVERARVRTPVSVCVCV